MQRLQGKSALITGASRGIGKAIALRLAQEGARVAINYRQSAAEAEELATQIRAEGGTAALFPADVSDATAAQGLVEAAHKAFGRLDLLINNAGITRDNLMLAMEPEDWDAVLATNLDAVFHCCRAAARFMVRQRYGRIVNLSSAAGDRPNRGQVNYAAAKGGINALTRALAMELASRNITVNAVAPGMIETDMSREIRAMAGDQILPMIALHRYGTPEDVAAAVPFLLSPDADYITGQVIHVDGGLRA